MDILLKFIILIISFIGIVMLSMAEAAFFGMPLKKIKIQSEIGNDNCKLLLELRSNLALSISGLLIAHTALSIIAGILISLINFTEISEISVLCIFTLLFLIFGEIIPKTYGLFHAEKMAPRFAMMIRTVTNIFYPFASICALITQIFINIECKEK